ncbi:hypothetical protein D7318_30385 [Streptomyces radicis]|uniref:Uncharacterized protein n=1 Tax=Streptomyces radicis TaxID=1750517 RepID=A0ABX9QV40_9ACTN|nr:hypothetical protein D7318_30385 [Streptomyces radicis]
MPINEAGLCGAVGGPCGRVRRRRWGRFFLFQLSQVGRLSKGAGFFGQLSHVGWLFHAAAVIAWAGVVWVEIKFITTGASDVATASRGVMPLVPSLWSRGWTRL